MRRPKTPAGVAREIFVEQDEIPEMGIVPVARILPMTGPFSGRVLEERGGEAPFDFDRSLFEVHESR
jgi:hypothetical protein